MPYVLKQIHTGFYAKGKYGETISNLQKARVFAGAGSAANASNYISYLDNEFEVVPVTLVEVE